MNNPLRFQEPFKALGSDIELTLITDSEAAARDHFARLRAEVRAFDQRFSRFKPDSEITYINERAGTKTGISRQMHELLAASLEQAKLTGNLFNPLVLPDLQRAGYQSSWPHPDVKSNAPLYLEGKVQDPVHIELEAGFVTLPARTAIDFGGIGKGHLLEILARLTETVTSDFWFSLGGDILASGHDLSGRPWEIGVARAADETALAGSFTGPGAVATSGVTKRRGVHAGRAWHHIIDPRTGQPAATDLLTVSLQHPDAVAADVLATCAVIVGTDAAWEFVHSRGAAGAILQAADAVTKYGSAR